MESFHKLLFKNNYLLKNKNDEVKEAPLFKSQSELCKELTNTEGFKYESKKYDSEIQKQKALNNTKQLILYLTELSLNQTKKTKKGKTKTREISDNVLESLLTVLMKKQHFYVIDAKEICKQIGTWLDRIKYIDNHRVGLFYEMLEAQLDSYSCAILTDQPYELWNIEENEEDSIYKKMLADLLNECTDHFLCIPEFYPLGKEDHGKKKIKYYFYFPDEDACKRYYKSFSVHLRRRVIYHIGQDILIYKNYENGFTNNLIEWINYRLRIGKMPEINPDYFDPYAGNGDNLKNRIEQIDPNKYDRLDDAYRQGISDWLDYLIKAFIYIIERELFLSVFYLKTAPAFLFHHIICNVSPEKQLDSKGFVLQNLENESFHIHKMTPSDIERWYKLTWKRIDRGVNATKVFAKDVFKLEIPTTEAPKVTNRM